MRIITVVGARPQFIKAASVSRALDEYNANSPDLKIKELVVHSGQHFDQNMSSVFFEELKIPKPHINLNIGSGSHGVQTGRMLEKLDGILANETPDVVLVYGDTNTTLAGALAASKRHIPILHVEAGLRSFNKKMPEEQNRVLTDHLSTILFCPTMTAVKNLEKEGFDINNRKIGGGKQPPSSDTPAVVLCGDVMLDCVLYYASLSDEKRGLLHRLGLCGTGPCVSPYALVTIHRPENTDNHDRLHAILSALSKIASSFRVILPLHPRTRKIIENSSELSMLCSSLTLIDPVSYLEMIQLQKHSSLICTDSGGVQKEAYFLEKPCITMRDQTEWVETVASGWNAVTAADREKILNAFETVQEWKAGDQLNPPFSRRTANPIDRTAFGNGDAASRIVDTIIEFLSTEH